jgi:putative endonuclease
MTHHLDTGEIGEQLVATWLTAQHHKILKRRWSCRLGEIDLISMTPDDPRSVKDHRTIALVEVKTRSTYNWDIDGLLALTPSKQRKLWKTAELFILAHPQWANRPFRFDVALVRHSAAPPRTTLLTERYDDRHFSLHTYIPNAFEG